MNLSSVRMSPTWLSLAPLLLVFAYACSSESDVPELLPNQSAQQDSPSAAPVLAGHAVRGSLATRSR